MNNCEVFTDEQQQLLQDFLDLTTQKKIDKSIQYRNVRSKRMNKNRTLIIDPKNNEVTDE